MTPPMPRRAMLALAAAALAGRAQGQTAGGTDNFTLGGDGSATTAAVVIPLIGPALLPVSVNGGPVVPFVFDTGSSLSLLDHDFAVRNNVRTEWGSEGEGAKGNDAAVGVASNVAFQIGAVTIPPQSAAVMRIPNHILDRGNKPRIAGILGLPVFATAPLRLDLLKRTLTWLTPGTAADPAGIAVPLSVQVFPLTASSAGLSPRMLTVPVTLEGITQDFVLDTGSGSDILLGYDNARQLNARRRYAKYVDMKEPAGIDGAIEISAAFGNRLSVGRAVLAPPLVGMKMDPPDASPQRWARPDFDGLLGLPALSHHVLFLDIAGERLVLEPGGLPVPAKRQLWSCGICADKPERNHFTVLSVIKGTPAERAGIAPGDRIVTVNGIPAMDLGLAGFGMLTDAPGGKQARLGFADGRQLTLASVQLLP